MNDNPKPSDWLPVEDTRPGPDLPSYMTLKELQTLFVFATKFALEGGIALDSDQVPVGILVRDRGYTGAGMKAPWIEFSIGDKWYAFWRATMDLYEIGPDGAVGDDPIHRNE